MCAQNSLIRKTTPTIAKSNVETTIVSEDVYTTNWNTKKFNPYSHDEVLEFPFEIDFTNQQFTMPVIGFTTSRYGFRNGKHHKGMDIDLKTGDIVKTVMDGKVRFAKYYSGFGNVVVVRHSNGLETIYAHLSKILVEPNDYVFSGSAIGLGGNTGKSTGSHLHFEVRYKNHSIHPEYLFDLEGTQQLHDDNKLLVTKFWTQPNKHRSTKKSNIVLHRPVFTVKEEDKPINNKYNAMIIRSSNNSPTFTKNATITNTLHKTRAKKINKVNVDSTPKTHTISTGENFRTIAQTYKTTIEKLCTLNGFTRTSRIEVGQIIYIP